jgi:hypothetical protein
MARRVSCTGFPERRVGDLDGRTRNQCVEYPHVFYPLPVLLVVVVFFGERDRASKNRKPGLWKVAVAVFMLVPQKAAKGSLLLQSNKRDQLPFVDDLLE